MLRSYLFLLLATPMLCSAQANVVLRDSILSLFGKMRAENDSVKVESAERLERLLADFYADPSHFELEFDSVPFMGQLSAWDKMVSLTCWNLALSDGEFKYHCVMRHRVINNGVVVTVFEDKDPDWARIERKPIRSKDWYGVLYYKLLANRYRGHTIYTVLGWDGVDNITNRKVVDVINIQGNVVSLGAPVFKDEKGTSVQRLIYEYANDVSMALNYDDQEKMIIMDHLAPEDSRFEGQRQFYGPDFSYDALQFVKGEWVFLKDVFAKNRSLNNLPDDNRPGDFKD